MRSGRYGLWMLSGLVFFCAKIFAAPSLVTEAERSGFKRTGRYDEVERLCADFQARYPARVRCMQFGTTPELRPMLALIVSGEGIFDPATARSRNRPVVLMQGGIHAGEIDGKDAGFLVLREMLSGKAAAAVLSKLVFVFVPVFNVDGHERFGPNNRPNQVGPEQMGWRVTAQNFNLNRDYVKADAPEMRAMLELLNEWDPLLYADLHVTDGAKFQHDISLNVAPTLAGDADLQRAGVQLRDALVQKLATQGSLPLDFYPSFIVDDDPSSGIAAAMAPPRFSHEYWALRNRIGVLVETHSWKNYPTRVRITHNAIVDMLELVAEHSDEWTRAARAADEHAAQIGGTNAVLTYENTDDVRTFEFRGYEYSRTPSAISGGLVTKYNDKRPQIWRIPLRDKLRPAITVQAPRGGYIVPVAYAALVREKLDAHGIRYSKISAAKSHGDVETFRATTATLSSETFESHTTANVRGEWKQDSRDIPAGSLFVPIAQPHSHVVLALLEPQHPDSLVSWGYFNNCFERKEYMEPYVAEAVAEQMLGRDAALRAEFEKRLATDAKFAQSPSARLDFFYKRHPSWDERVDLYPIYRTAETAW